MGNTGTNPAVGAIVVKDEKILGMGWHNQYGGEHAEVVAINSCKDLDLFNSELYVTLEPCNHHGKTPPCTDLIINSKISKVVVTSIDPNSEVDGNGIKRLINSGIEVCYSNYAEIEEKLNGSWRFFVRHKKPLVRIKLALTNDGFIGDGSSRIKISGSASDRIVQELRRESDAILIGRNTFTTDNPSLNCRVRNYRKYEPDVFIFSNHALDFSHSNILNYDRKKIYIVSSDDSVLDSKNDGICSIRYSQLFKEFANNNYKSVLCEGGSSLSNQLINDGLVDELLIIRSKTINLGSGIFFDENILLNDYRIVEEIENKDDLICRYLKNVYRNY